MENNVIPYRNLFMTYLMGNIKRDAEQRVSLILPIINYIHLHPDISLP